MKHTLTLLAALLLSSLAAYAADAPKPNILLIITDDQGYGDFSIHGNTHLQTPHIDKLGAEGVRFERFYVNSFCAPTRAALLTGRNHTRVCNGQISAIANDFDGFSGTITSSTLFRRSMS